MSDSPKNSCPFCHITTDRILAENSLAVAIADGFPVTPGHTLVIPRRHTADFFELSVAEVQAIVELLHEARRRLLAERAPAGFNVGINAGKLAGQTVMHAHIHLIPRYADDVPDPTGGVRNVIPGKANYLGK